MVGLFISKETNNNNIRNALDFLSKKGPNEEYQKILINYCFSNYDINQMNNILNLKYFDFNLEYDNFSTLLCYAIEIGNIEIISSLLNNPKIDVNQRIINFYISIFVSLTWN